MPKNNSLKILASLVLACSLLIISGCQGCRDDSEKTAEEIKKEEEEKKERDKPSFETEPAVYFPGQFTNVAKANRTKRGHWVAADFRITANKFDAQGDITATGYALTTPAPVENSDYFAVSSRPFSIAKGEQKNLATNIYLPRRDRGSSANVMFNLVRSSGGLSQLSELHPVSLLKAHQYHMVLLTNRADSYSYLPIMDSIVLPDTEEGSMRIQPFYTVIRTRPDKEPIPLARHSLYWTTISYIFWDDLNPDQLDADQQQALVDWIHFGGQLILSGPDCLEVLSNSFLADYLPASVSRSRNFNQEDFAELNANWEVPDADLKMRRKIVASDDLPIIGVDFEPHEDSTFVDKTGKIAIERQVGRGRIVATAFSMDDKPVYQWPSYGSFFNGALLRRPGRRFGLTNDDNLAFHWVNDDTSIFDPLLGSTLRYLSRDLAYFDETSRISRQGTSADPRVTTQMIHGLIGGQMDSIALSETRYRTRGASRNESRNLDDHWHYGGFVHDEQSGTAGWNDRSGISMAARNTLRDSAGISPPSSGFVLKMLSIYLLVLVPVNWAIFRVMGRVEWAWIAAPFIAIAGAVMVAKMASLDIGFVRSNTQVACLEVYADFNRAHVSQYSALYTSLSTGYDLELDNQSAQSLPFGDPDKVWRETTIKPVTMRQTINRRLEGFQVQSNSTGMLHTEMMVDMQGAFSRFEDSGQSLIENSTVFNVSEAAVLRREENGNLVAAWIGDLPAGSTSDPLSFEPIADFFEPWNGSAVLDSVLNANRFWERIGDDLEENEDGVDQATVAMIFEVVPELESVRSEFLRLLNQTDSNQAGTDIESRRIGFRTFSDLLKRLNQDANVSVSALFRQVGKNLQLANNEVRLIGVTNDSIGNNSFDPASTQTQQQTLVVVHLRRPPLMKAERDVNTIADVTGFSNLDHNREIEAMDQMSEGPKDE